MTRDVEFNVTASDKTGTALASAEAKFAASQERIVAINKAAQKKIQSDNDESAARIGRRLEQVFGSAAPKLSAKLAEVFGAASANGAPILAGAAVAAAPLIGATISAAIIGGAGVGGVIGGIMLVKDDPRVSAAGKQLGENMFSGLKEDAQVFVDPVLSSIGEIDEAFQDLRPRVKSIFEDSSAFVGPLTEGALRATDGILRGFQKLVSKAEPVMDQLGDSIGDIGDATGDMLEMIAGGSEGAAAALEDITQDMTILIRTTGLLVRGLTEVYGFMQKIGLTTALMGPLGQAMDVYQKVTGKASEETDHLREGLDLAAKEWDRNQEGIETTNQYLADSQKLMDDAEQAARDLTRANGALYDSETDVAGALAKATQARKDNGRTLDANTTKGRANRDALSSVAKALQAQYDNTVKVNGQGPKTVAAGEALRAKFIQVATSFTGSADKARALANQILGIPAKKDARIDVKSNAAAASKAAKDALNSVHSKTITVTVKVNQSQLNKIERQLGGKALLAADQSFAVSDTSGSSRIGGPTPVSVSNNVSVSLDGAPFAAMTVRTVEASARRSAHRAKVGKR